MRTETSLGHGMTQKWRDLIETEELKTTAKQTPAQLKDSRNNWFQMLR